MGLLLCIINFSIFFSEFLKLFFGGGAFGDFDDVEANSFGQRTALADRNRVTLRHVAETRRTMSGNVTMTLFKTLVFPDKMQVISSNDDRSLHLHFLDDASQNSATNLYQAGERALLVDVNSVLRLNGSFKSQSNVLRVSNLFRIFATQELRFAI